VLSVLTVRSCDAQFTASSAVNGTFASPGFPRSYPDDVTCRYRFSGRHGDRVQIRFTAFNLLYSASDANSRKNTLPEYATQFIVLYRVY